MCLLPIAVYPSDNSVPLSIRFLHAPLRRTSQLDSILRGNRIVFDAIDEANDLNIRVRIYLETFCLWAFGFTVAEI